MANYEMTLVLFYGQYNVYPAKLLWVLRNQLLGIESDFGCKYVFRHGWINFCFKKMSNILLYAGTDLGITNM